MLVREATQAYQPIRGAAKARRRRGPRRIVQDVATCRLGHHGGQGQSGRAGEPLATACVRAGGAGVPGVRNRRWARRLRRARPSAKGVAEPSLEAARPAPRHEPRWSARSGVVSAAVGCGSRSVGRRSSRLHGDYSTEELSRLDALVDDLHAAGVRVILTTYAVPPWASQTYWWSHPPRGYAEGPQPFYPDPRRTCLGRLRRLGPVPCRAAMPARCRRSRPGTSPTCGRSSIRSGRADDPYFARPDVPRACSRLSMPAWSAPIPACASSPAPRRPVGLNDIYRTSPQRFARFFSRAGAARSLRRLLASPVHAGRLDLRTRPARRPTTQPRPSPSPTSAPCCGCSPASRST